MTHKTSNCLRALWVLAFVYAAPLTPAQGDIKFESVDEAVHYVKLEIERDNRRRRAAIVVCFRYADGGDEPATVRFFEGGGRKTNNLHPGVVCARALRLSFGPIGVEVEKRGYYPVKQTFEAAEGDVLVIDDIVLERVPDDERGEIVGNLWLEGKPHPGGITVKLAERETTTDEQGRFTFRNVLTGPCHVHVSSREYRGLSKQLYIEPRSRNVVSLRGYRERTARVRWAYQPNGSRDLSDGLQTGEAILGERGKSRIVWADGFAPTRSGADLVVRQIEDRLLFNFSSRTTEGPGGIRLADIILEEVLQAPKVDYPAKDLELHVGNVFIFKTRDGQHYGKIQIMDIIIGKRPTANQD